MKATPASPLFLLFFCLFVLAAAPVWVPLAMLASLATGKSLRELNEEVKQ